MNIFSLLIMIPGGLVVLAGYVWLLFIIFRDNVLWGIGALFIPLVGLAYAVTHWQQTRSAFGLYIVGALVLIGGALLV